MYLNPHLVRLLVEINGRYRRSRRFTIASQNQAAHLAEKLPHLEPTLRGASCFSASILPFYFFLFLNNHPVHSSKNNSIDIIPKPSFQIAKMTIPELEGLQVEVLADGVGTRETKASKLPFSFYPAFSLVSPCLCPQPLIVPVR